MEIIILNEISQTEKDKHCMFSLHIQNPDLTFLCSYKPLDCHSRNMKLIHSPSSYAYIVVEITRNMHIKAEKKISEVM
jgi:hypothetical protein